MPAQPELKETVTKDLNQYRVAANVTGYFLLLITALYVIRLTNSTDLWLAGPHGFLTFEHFILDADGFKTGFPSEGINLTSIVLIVHGWLYVLYLFADFRLWTLMRWSFFRFLIIAAGGIVPLLSFFTESYYAKLARKQLSEIEGQK